MPVDAQEPVALYEGSTVEDIAELDTYGRIGERVLLEVPVLLCVAEIRVVAPRDAHIDISPKHRNGIVLLDT
jgi:hypothetical protein